MRLGWTVWFNNIYRKLTSFPLRSCSESNWNLTHVFLVTILGYRQLPEMLFSCELVGFSSSWAFCKGGRRFGTFGTSWATWLKRRKSLNSSNVLKLFLTQWNCMETFPCSTQNQTQHCKLTQQKEHSQLYFPPYPIVCKGKYCLCSLGKTQPENYAELLLLDFYSKSERAACDFTSEATHMKRLRKLS